MKSICTSWACSIRKQKTRSTVLAYLDQILVWAAILLALALIILLARWWKGKKYAKGRRRFVEQSLTKAREQKVSLEIKLASGQAGLNCELVSIRPAGLELKSPTQAGEEWNKKPVEAFFHISEPEGPVFFVFTSRVLSLTQSNSGSTLLIAAPDHLRVEKKRHFVRAVPPESDVRMIAVWPMQPGRRLPRSNSDLGQPVAAWKNGQANAPVQLENISGGGLALRFTAPETGEQPIQAEKGRQMFCLLVFRPAGGQDKIIFWCSGEIMNIRRTGNTVSVGLEFTNWAVQEPGSTEIRWTHSSPWQGARPILRWIEQIDRPKA